jgi:cell division protein FtsB
MKKRRPISSPARLREGGKTIDRATIVRSRGFVLVLIVVCLVLSLSVVREGIKRFQIAREIHEMEGKIAVQEQRNAQMQATTKILNTSAAKEKQSRISLNTMSPGEQVIVIQSPVDSFDAEDAILPSGQNIGTVSQQSRPSNPKKWANYFFNK